MIKKLRKVGNSQALILDKGILELLNIDNQTPLDVSTNGDIILIKPIRDKKKQEQLQKNLELINDKYGDVLKKLAE
jgi:antitoxin component of MazEF toxin-antitoxin module